MKSNILSALVAIALPFPLLARLLVHGLACGVVGRAGAVLVNASHRAGRQVRQRAGWWQGRRGQSAAPLLSG